MTFLWQYCQNSNGLLDFVAENMDHQKKIF